MSEKSVNLNVQLLDKTFPMKCPESHVETLKAAAKHLNQEMRQLQDAGLVGFDRIAALAALEQTALYLKDKNHTEAYSSDLGDRLKRLNRQVVDCLTQVDQLEL